MKRFNSLALIGFLGLTVFDVASALITRNVFSILAVIMLVFIWGLAIGSAWSKLK